MNKDLVLKLISVIELSEQLLCYNILIKFGKNNQISKIKNYRIRLQKEELRKYVAHVMTK